MVTHNLDIVAETDRVVRLVAGRVESQPSSTRHLQIATIERRPHVYSLRL